MGVFVCADDEAWSCDGPVSVMLRGPGEKQIFLGEVEVFVGHAQGGRIFCHWHGGWAEVHSVVLSACLEEEALGDDIRDCEGGEKV